MMTTCLLLLAFCALLGFGSTRIRTAPPWLVATLQALDVVLTLGLATLALVSYLS